MTHSLRVTARSRNLRSGLCLGVLVFVGFLPLSVGARPNAKLEAARTLYNELRFEKALKALDEALVFSNTYQDLTSIYQLRGLSYAALKQPAAAREAFTYLLAIDPDHRLPDYAAPRMRRPLEAARAQLGPDGALLARVNAPEQVDGSAAPVVDVVLVNDLLGLVDRVRVDYRLQGETSAHSATALAGPTVSVRLDFNAATRPGASAIEYWVMLLDRNGGELHLIGSAESPQRIARNPSGPIATGPLAEPTPLLQVETDPPVWKRWWFWTAIGVVAVGAAGGVAWALWPSGPDCPSGYDCAHALP